MDIKEIVYKETVIPSLNDVTYGETIAKNFEIINDNFKRLSSIDFITFAAIGAQEPFSIRATVRFWKLRSVRCSINSLINGKMSAL